MPSKSSTVPVKRKTPSFKPPRPAPKSTKTSTAPRRKSAPVQRGRPSFIADQASASDDDDGDQDEEDDDDDDDEIPSDTNPPSAQSLSSEEAEESDRSLPAKNKNNPSTQDPPPTIPPALLTRLLHHHFKDDKMRIGKEANGVVGKYMETFVREAIARAAFERQEAGVEGMAGDFLEVEDLEKLAPQLLLDF